MNFDRLPKDPLRFTASTDATLCGIWNRSEYSAAWIESDTTTTLNVHVSMDKGLTFKQGYDKDGVEVTISVVANRPMPVPLETLGLHEIKFVGLATANVIIIGNG